MDPQVLSHLSTGASGAAFTYALVAIPFLIALATARPRPALPKLLSAPLLAIPITVVIAVLWSMARQTIVQHVAHLDITTLTTGPACCSTCSPDSWLAPPSPAPACTRGTTSNAAL